MTRAIDDTTARRASAFLRLESGLLRRLRHERTEQGSQSLAPTLGALDLPLVVLADRQGERHFTIALAAIVFVHWHRVTSFRCADSGGQVSGLTQFHAKNAIELGRLKTEFSGKVEVHRLPFPGLRGLRKMAAEVVREESEKTPMARKVHASFTKFQALVGPWDHVAEGAYHQLVAV